MAQRPLSEDQQRVIWNIRLRWGMIALILVVVLYLKFVGRFGIPITPCLITIGFMAAYNTFYPFLVRFFRPFGKSQAAADFREILDLVVITFMIHFTGGVESPFILLYLLELMAISLFRFTASSYYLAILATILYLSNSLMEGFFIIPHYRLSQLSGTLFISFDYIMAIGFALFFSSALLIFMASFLSGKFADKQRQIEELSKAKAEFMNDVMHETKSPLTSIIGYAEILAKGTFGQPNKEQENSLNVIRRQSHRILNMVNNLMDLAKIEAGKTKIEMAEHSLIDMIEHITEEMKPDLDSSKLELIVELDDKIPLFKMDENKITEVITNLLSNAIKFSKPHGKIFISTELREDEVQVSIRDEGLGIDAENLPHIFERFHRADKEAALVRGTGLGLALSKTIIDSHGGRIWAASAGRHKGAVFHFTLPLKTAA